MRLMLRFSVAQNFMETLISPPQFLLQKPPVFNRRASLPKSHISTATVKSIPIADEALMGFISGKMKATEVAHSAWKHIIQKGDAVIDATCGNGYDTLALLKMALPGVLERVWKNIIQKGDTVIDATCGNGCDTLALLKMVADESGKGCVYGMDIQNTALESTSSLLEESAGQDERKLVKLSLICHSKMEDVIPRDAAVRLVAFNLGYLPGGDKAIITRSPTTLMALQAASRMLTSGGLISMVVYVGHPGGRDELETVQSFASSLPMESWVSSKLEILNRPTCPVLVFLFKK